MMIFRILFLSAMFFMASPVKKCIASDRDSIPPLVFISDTQAPRFMETLLIKRTRNEEATRMAAL
jgi:hypothetical protein